MSELNGRKWQLGTARKCCSKFMFWHWACSDDCEKCWMSFKVLLLDWDNKGSFAWENCGWHEDNQLGWKLSRSFPSSCVGWAFRPQVMRELGKDELLLVISSYAEIQMAIIKEACLTWKLRHSTLPFQSESHWNLMKIDFQLNVDERAEVEQQFLWHEHSMLSLNLYVKNELFHRLRLELFITNPNLTRSFS